MTRERITPEQWAAARSLADVRRASYIRLKAEEWCADVYNELCVGASSLVLTSRPTTLDQVVACHVVAYLGSMGFDATWYREADGALKVYWGVPAAPTPTQHHQHALARDTGYVAPQQPTSPTHSHSAYQDRPPPRKDTP